jgi:hypothetical protein
MIVRLGVGQDSLMVNLDTGASEWMTLPPTFRDSVRWVRPLEPGPVVSNNQTGRTHVWRGTLRDPVRLGPHVLRDLLVYVNPDADGPWLGSAALQNTAWTFDPINMRLAIVPREHQ